ncbi:MAG: chromate efflux transporter [Elusimicrobia bacterium]|nr:chromate efflux transporter [Elusimicrobiota bacterium]
MEFVLTSSRFWEIFFLFSKLGATAFGGPFAVGYIEKEVAQKRNWVSSSWFAGSLGLMEAIPGPTATEMAIYCGYMRGGIGGGILAGVCYIYPSFFMMVLLSFIYYGYGIVPSIAAFFSGISPAVVAILVDAAYRMARSSVVRPGHLILFCLGFIFCYYFKMPVLPALFLGGVLGMVFEKMNQPALWSVFPLYLLISPFPVSSFSIPWAKLGVLFAKMVKIGSMVFGGGYVIVPFMAQDFVDKLHWLTADEFLVGFGLGKATPGPLSITSAFVGYKAAGLLGAFVSTLGMFLPCFVILLSLVPYFERIRANASARAFFRGIEVVTVGAVLAAASGLIQEALVSWSSVGVALLCFFLLPFLDTTLIFVLAGACGVTVHYW